MMGIAEDMGICCHCGGQHSENNCSVKDATRRILEGYRPRGATAGFSCPNGHGDGIWHWWPPTGAEGFSCEVCGAVVNHYTGESLSPVDQDQRLAARAARKRRS